MRLRFSLLLLLAACSSSSSPAPEPEAAPVAPAQSAVVDTDAPRLVVRADKPLEDRGNSELTASAVLAEGAVSYVAAQLPTETGLLRAHVSGSVYGLGMVTPNQDLLVVRFNGKAPESFDVTYEAPGEDGRPVAKGSFHVTVPKNTAKRASLSKDFFDGLAEWCQAVSEVTGADGFYAYAGQRALANSNHKAVTKDYALTDIEDAMALYTGARSLRDALQAERALKLKRTGKQTIAVNTLTPVPTEPHDWVKLNRELGLKPVMEPLAASVPAGMLYLHASSAMQLHKTVQSLTDRLAGIVEASGIESSTGDIVDRYARQLGIERSPAMSALADTAIDGIAVVSSDPFFREGTDITVLFHATNVSALEAGFDAREGKLAGTRSTYKVGAHEVRLTASTDQTLSRHYVRLDDVVAISNSRGAIEQIIAVKDGKTPSVAAGGDFAYLRALYPYDRSKEDAFAFIGDAFVAHVISPAFKIASARRVFALADDQAVRYSAMYNAWLDGRAQAGVKLPPRAFGKPLIETVVDKVSTEERDAYQSFSDSYQRAWSQWIDPAAVRITSSGNDLTLDARMLPITTRGEYTDIENLAGTSRIVTPIIRDGVQWVGAVGPEARLRRDLEGAGRSMMGGDFQLGWLGNWVMGGVADRPGLWDMAAASGALGEVDKPEGEGFIPPVWRTILNHAPLYVGAEVRNPVALAGMLAAAKGMVESAAPGLVEWTADEPLGDVPVSIIREGAESGAPAEQRIALRYAVANGAFVASLDRPTLAAQLAAIKEGRGPKNAPSATKPVPTQRLLSEGAQAGIDYAPGIWLTKIVAAMADRVSRVNAQRADFADQAVAPYLTGITDAAERTRLTTDLLGYAPHSTDATTLAGDLAKLRHATFRLAVEGIEAHRGLHTAVTLTE